MCCTGTCYLLRPAAHPKLRVPPINPRRTFVTVLYFVFPLSWLDNNNCKWESISKIGLIMAKNQRFGSISFWRGSRSGSGSWDPHLEKVDPDPDPRIQLSIIVDPDPRNHIWKKWIRIRFQSGSGSGSEYLFFIFFIKKFMSDKLQCLFCYRQNLEKAFLR